MEGLRKKCYNSVSLVRKSVNLRMLVRVSLFGMIVDVFRWIVLF